MWAFILKRKCIVLSHLQIPGHSLHKVNNAVGLSVEKMQNLSDKHIFVYCRMYYSGGTWHKPQSSFAVLLDKYWTKLQMGNMTREELKKVRVIGLKPPHTHVVDPTQVVSPLSNSAISQEDSEGLLTHILPLWWSCWTFRAGQPTYSTYLLFFISTSSSVTSHMPSLHVGAHQQISQADGGVRSSPGYLLPAHRRETLWPGRKQLPNPWWQPAAQVWGQKHTAGGESPVTEVRPSSLLSLPSPYLPRIIHVLMSLCPDYGKSVFSCLNKTFVSRLQLVQNAAARLLAKTRGRKRVTPILTQFHWLPVRFRFHFKILLGTYETSHGIAPSYFNNSFIKFSLKDNLDQLTNCSYSCYQIAPTLWKRVCTTI